MPAALDILQQTFGYPSFRGPQETIIQTIIDGDDALVLMPTGGGKSLCYQSPAFVRPGCGVVISPAVALLQDRGNAMAPPESHSLGLQQAAGRLFGGISANIRFVIVIGT